VPAIVHSGPGLLVQVLIIGVATGCIYALIALGYTMVYGIVELINFAHGDVFTLGAFVSLPLISLLGIGGGLTGVAGVLALLAVFVITMVATGTANVVIERVAYRPLRNAPRLAPLITAVGMSFFLEGVMFIWRGANNLSYPALLPGNQITLGSVTIGAPDVIVVAITIILGALLAYFVNGTRLGKAMRATAQDRDAARLMGIDIDRTISVTFFIGAALAGAGGIVYGLYVHSVFFQLGFETGLVAFTAAVFGGIGNIPGAALGGLLIGLIRALNDSYWDTTWTDPVTFAILIAVLTLRPTGLLGMRVPEK
jgi:branched-chain amino acid transport system permease protein